MKEAYDPFRYRHKFQDDVWGQIKLNDLERDVIDTPEFQRLFRTSQLGFVDLVYHTANHTRGAHCIGACHIADRLISRLVENTSELYQEYEADCPGLYADFEISPTERVLIRLGALVHDISHLPLSHDLEKKSHKIFCEDNKELKLRSWYGHYDKHDDYESNPLLFVLLCDHENSVLARVIRHYSKRFYADLQKDAKLNDRRHGHISGFVELVHRMLGNNFAPENNEWDPEKDLLPQLLFHLLVYEKPEKADNPIIEIMTRFAGVKEKWHLGPKSLSEADAKSWHNSWYQPFRHDIIGNTLSADLIDYLTRDPRRLGTHRGVDLHLLSYYALVNPQQEAPLKRYRCAIDLHDHKRGTTRTFLLNDLFRLLDLRQDIHEKAAMHRVVQSANAMLARGLLLLGKEDLPGEDKRPLLKEVVGLGENQHHAMQGEDLFFDQLLEICDNRKGASPATVRRLDAARRIFEKLTERRVYRPLMIIPGDLAAEKLPLPKGPGNDAKTSDFPLRTLAAIVDSAYYSPFLLFVCSCVEKYLQGVFDTSAELCRYAQRIARDEAHESLIIEQAMTLVPRRVIVWTAPYKQLYKDPAVVVALEGCVGQIDELNNSHTIRDKATRERIQSAISDADSKYATLWQLYVFISDGLFYSGLLDKIIAHLPTGCTVGQKRDNHENRLKNAQALLSVAFGAVCINWANLSTKVDDAEKLLQERMDAKAFRDLVGRWVGEYGDERGRIEKLSTVDIRHYYHEYSLDPKVPDALKRPCRDTRYKFGKTSEQAWLRAANDLGSEGHKLIQFLRTCYADDPQLLSEAEFKQVVQLYRDEDTRQMCDAFLSRAAADQTRIPDALKALCLAGFPWPEREKKETAEREFPKTDREVEEWLLREAKILHPNVRRQLTENIRPLVDVLVSTSSRHGRAVFDDFELRLRNESTLCWNVIRTGRVVTSLKRKWKHFDEPTLPEGNEDN
jgi:HD superfamily phosphohydrolase